MAERAPRRASGSRWFGLLVPAIAALATFVSPSSVAEAHDDIAGSTPADRSVIDAPISTASIDFGEVIGESVELFLTYDPGGGDAIVDIGGETVKTGDSTARIDFPELSMTGTYFLQYLAPVPADGHVIIGSVSFTYGEPTAIDEGDNADLRSSTPASRERIDGPISSAEIEFDLEITDDVALQLVYDRGDGENFDELDGTTQKTGPRSASLTFDEIGREGTYFITYDATSVVTGDEIVGATSFVFGEPSSSSSGFPIVGFLALSVPVLALGAWFTLRNMRSGGPDDTDGDGDGDGPHPVEAVVDARGR